MRRLLPYLLGLTVLTLLGLFLLPLWLGSAPLPGTDLSRFHPRAVPGHVEALKAADAAAREKAATTLWQIGAAARQATPALLQAAKDADPRVRAAAVKALGRTGQETQDAVPALTEALRDDRAEVRAAAATSLAETWSVADKVRPGGQVRVVRGGNPREVVRLTPSYEALARNAVPPLTAALGDADARVRAAAAEALAETGPLAEPAVPDLVGILQRDADRDARLQATLALARAGPAARAAVPVLIERLRAEKADGVRVNTAVALGMVQSSPQTAVPALVETVLRDPDPDARGAAMYSIGQFGPEARVAIPLLEAAKDPKNRPSEESVRNIDRLLQVLRAKAEGAADKK